MFDGRLMTCFKCGFQFQSRPKLESMFTTIETDGKLIDVCPKCWGIPNHLVPPEVKEAREKWLKDQEDKS